MRFQSLFKPMAVALLAIVTATAGAQGWPNGYGGVMLQGFSWDSYSDTQWTNLESMASDLDGSFDLLWIPNAGNAGSGSQMGYSAKYWFPVGTNYTSSFGTLAQLRSMVSAMRSHGIGIIGDVVINHRANVSNWTDFPSETYNGTTYCLTASDICSDDDGGETANHLQSGEYLGNADTGDGWTGLRDLDHTSTNVQNNVKAYLSMLINNLEYTGFRYDMVSGYAPKYIKTYNNYACPSFSVGECWKTASEIKTWIDGTKDNGTPTSAAFDFQFRYTVRNAINGNDWTKLNQANTGSQGYPLVSNNFESGGYKQWAVTFVENHDMQDRGNVTGYSKDPIVSDTLAANAYMLAMPGTPCVFLPHYKAYKQEIKNMIAARKAAGVTNTSSYSVSSSQSTRFLTSTTGSKTRLICAVGSGATNYTGPTNSVQILAGYHYKYFMPSSANIAWVDVPSGTYGEAFNVTLTAVSASYTTLVYTLDGSAPTASSPSVTNGGTVHITGDATLTVALLNGSSIVNGSIATRNYKVQATKKITVYLKDPGWDNVYFKIFQASDGNNDSGTYGVKVTDTKMVHGDKFYYRTFESTDLNYYFNMLFCDGSWGNDHQTANINNVNQDVYYEITGGGGNSKLTVTDVTDQYTGAYTATVYFKDPGWDNVYYYAWDENGQRLGDWPGQQVTQTTTVDGDTYYYLAFEMQSEQNPINVIFSNNTGTQTVDVTGITSDTFYVLDHATDSQGHHYVLNPGEKSVTVYFKDPSTTVSDWTNVSYYAWNSEGNQLGGWPGTQITDTKVVSSDTYYYHRFILDENATINVIFNNAVNGGSSTKQTTNIENIATDTYYLLTGGTSGGKYLWETVTPSTFEPYPVTVYFKQPENGWNNVSFHAWGTGMVKNDDNTVLNDTWPGQAGTPTYIDGEPWFSRTFIIAAEGAKVNVVINNNNQGNQTVDIKNIDQDVYYVLGAKNGDKYEVTDAGDMTEVITGVTLNHNLFRLGIRATQQLVATVSGSHVTTPVTWTSSDENVVTVTNGPVAPVNVTNNGPRRSASVAGMIYGVAGGTATVTASVGEFSASCSVTVDPTTGLLTVDSARPRVTMNNGLVVIESPVASVAQLTAPDGRSHRVVVHAGINLFPAMGHVTIVSIGDQVYKLHH